MDIDSLCTGGLILHGPGGRAHPVISSARDAFDIEGLGETYVELFYREGLLKEPADMFAD